MAILRAVSSSGWASTFFYAFLSPAFRREHSAVLAGRIRHHDQSSTGDGVRYLVRRNIHRLEKGLIMRPRRDVFGLDYIRATAEGYRRMNDGDPSEEVDWARDVLATYFSTVGSHPTVDSLRPLFERERIEPGGSLRTPYARDLSQSPSVTIEDLHTLSRRRRSVRWFESRPVPRHVIDRAVEVAAQSPSACNRQPYHFRVFDDADAARRVGSIPMGTKGFAQNFPAVAVLVGDQSAYFSERDRHVIYIDASLAAMAFLFALESQGVASCCINWPDIEPLEARMVEELDLKPYERVIMLIAFGFPDPEGRVPFSQKRSLDDVRTYA